MNPETLASLALPVIDGTWVVALDCAGHAGGLAFLMVFDSQASGSRTSFGEILVGGQHLLRRIQPHSGGLVRFAESVPNHLALYGLRACAQGLCTGSPGAQLSNALDLVLGF